MVKVRKYVTDIKISTCPSKTTHQGAVGLVEFSCPATLYENVVESQVQLVVITIKYITGTETICACQPF